MGHSPSKPSSARPFSSASSTSPLTRHTPVPTTIPPAPTTSPPTHHGTSTPSPVEEEITTPAPARHIHHLSELIDLDELFPPKPSPTPYPSPSPFCNHNNNSFSDPNTKAHAGRTLIQSPSGQQLDAWQYLSRKDRPLTVQERRERIQERMEREERERRREVLRGLREGGRRGRGWCCWGWG
ncbi:MAG: hypothetical protein Q9195_007503 [Heterodermia aff. obscurata]